MSGTAKRVHRFGTGSMKFARNDDFAPSTPDSMHKKRISVKGLGGGKIRLASAPMSNVLREYFQEFIAIFGPTNIVPFQANAPILGQKYRRRLFRRQ
jgi:hypothetical protein